MHNGLNTTMNKRPQHRARTFSARTKRGPSSGTSSATRHGSNDSQNARRSYERYVALAQAEAQSGNTIGAENFYQYAEHYFRSMSSSDHGAT
jgi:hypothetical protein